MAPPKIDGSLDDEAWKGAAVASRFWIVAQERWPTEQTEALVTSDSKYLYVAFRVYDSQPDAIVALDTRRDAALKQDDQVAVELDPFLSHREVSSYSINARGTVSDSIAGGRASQREWKGPWEGASQRTEYGWSAEIAIPFDILNFEPGTTAFGVNFLRYHNRTAEWSSWADTTVMNLPEERGRLVGLRLGKSPERSPFTFMPYVFLGRNVPDTQGEIRSSLATAGIDMRYQGTKNQTGVLSIKPDFSQVEEAITSIDFSYNEKFRVDNRPFFQEGSAYFSSATGKDPDKDKGNPQLTYFYSQRVPNFDIGGKYFGRTGGYQYGLMATRSLDSRWDGVVRLQRELTAAHTIGATFVGVDSPSLKNTLVAVNAQGRQVSGLFYQFDTAISRDGLVDVGGSFVHGGVGWRKNFWTFKLATDRYALDYNPALGLLDLDLRDTHGLKPTISYYRDVGSGPFREVTGYISGEQRYTNDGRLQRRTQGTGGTVELRQQQIRFGLYYSEGPYRRIRRETAGNWSDTLNQDHYYSATVDFNTRNSRLLYGATHATGFLGGGTYEYTTGYLSTRPTAATSLGISAAHLVSFGTYRQIVVKGGWDISPRHSVYSRYYTYNGNRYVRFAYVYRMRTNTDLFVVYDKNPLEPAKLSAKLVVTWN